MSARDEIRRKSTLHGISSPHVAGDLARLHHQLCREIDELAAPHRLCSREWHMLDVLVRLDGVEPKHLAPVLGVSLLEATQVLDNLTTEALAFRLPERPQAHVRIHASERGLKVHAELSARILRIERQVFSPLTFREFEFVRQAIGSSSMPPRKAP